MPIMLRLHEYWFNFARCFLQIIKTTTLTLNLKLNGFRRY